MTPLFEKWIIDNVKVTVKLDAFILPVGVFGFFHRTVEGGS